MAPPDRPLVIDGFTSVQAVKRAGANRAEPHYGKSRTRLTAAEKRKKQEAGGSRVKGRIGHSVLPTNYEIVCFECGYTFNLRGKLRKTYCPKCRAILDVDEHVIDKPWSGTVKTIGTVEVAEGGSLSGAHIITGDLVLNGHVERSEIRVCRRLELGPHAAGEVSKIPARDILIRKDIKLSIRSKLHADNFIVYGDFRGSIEISGLVTLHPGACLRGRVRAARLVVLEGAGIKADVEVKT